MGRAVDMLCVLLFCLFSVACASFSASLGGQIVYDAPSLPPGMTRWRNYEHDDGPWYQLINIEMNKLQSDVLGKPKKHAGNERKRKNDYWWVPKGTTNLTVGPWFPDGSTTTMVRADF